LADGQLEPRILSVNANGSAALRLLRSQPHHNLHMPKWMLSYTSTLAGCEVSNHVPTAECSSNPTAYRAFAK
jgi:hypothetical protein